MNTIANRLGFDPRQTVAGALLHGLIHMPPSAKPVIETRMQKWRAANVAAGLTANGKQRKRTKA